MKKVQHIAFMLVAIVVWLGVCPLAPAQSDLPVASAEKYPVPAGNDFKAVAGGGYHSLALRKDGSIVAWGWNDRGQCDMPTGNDL